MKKYLAILILILSATYADGQLKTYVVAEAGPAWDISRVRDPGKMFSQSQLYGSVGGISVWQEVIDNMSIGTGVCYHMYLSGINPTDNRPGQPGIQSYRSVLFPARISYRIRKSGFPVTVTPQIGYQYGKVLSEPSIQNVSSLISNEAGIVMNYNLTEAVTSATVLHLLEAGVSVDYQLGNNWQISATFSHFSGLSEIKSATVNYLTSEGSIHQAIYTNDGSRFQTTIGLYAPLSNIWEKKDVRLRRKIEQAYGGSGVKKFRYIYLGGDFGTLWRSFSTSNPAVGPRPITGRGIFRYANMHTGAYLGYIFNGTSGVDLGAYYQRSSSSLSLMYDHEVDFVTRERAPLFLEFPLTYRYFYDLYDNQLRLVPSIGASLITHFSGPGYGTGSGNYEYSAITGPATGTVSYTGNRTARFGYMIRAGIGIEYDLPVKLPLAATFNVIYSHGLKTFDQLEVVTSTVETPSTSTISYNGTGWHASVGVRMPFLLGKANRKCGALPRVR